MNPYIEAQNRMSELKDLTASGYVEMSEEDRTFWYRRVCECFSNLLLKTNLYDSVPAWINAKDRKLNLMCIYTMLTEMNNDFKQRMAAMTIVLNEVKQRIKEADDLNIQQGLVMNGQRLEKRINMTHDYCEAIELLTIGCEAIRAGESELEDRE